MTSQPSSGSELANIVNQCNLCHDVAIDDKDKAQITTLNSLRQYHGDEKERLSRACIRCDYKHPNIAYSVANISGANSQNLNAVNV